MYSIVSLLESVRVDGIMWSRPYSDQIRPFLIEADAQLFLRYSEYQLQKMYNQGQMLPMTSTIQNNLYTLNGVLDLSKKVSRNHTYNRIASQYQQGVQNTAVLIQMNPKKYYCIYGEKGLRVAKELGISPVVFVIKSIQNRFTEPFQTKA